MAAEGDNIFEAVMVCFTQTSSCGADRHPEGGGGDCGYQRRNHDAPFVMCVDPVYNFSSTQHMRTYQFPA